MRNIKLTIEFDGSEFCGWQKQPKGRTVQKVIEEAIFKATGEEIIIMEVQELTQGFMLRI